ncbi:hypothetical protein BGX30_003288 [Mortierella sp. GBA39]|nr:hypothetical protein BGX30_003288 [Mortierella sp. GBA39]
MMTFFLYPSASFFLFASRNIMILFKRFNKNKSESTTSSPAQTPVQTPCQTPRTSIQTLRDAGIRSNPDPDKIIRKATRTAMTSAAIPMSVR